MAKAILVIDMYDTCLNCDLYCFGHCYPLQKQMTIDEVKNIPSWCPLKLLPEKLPEVSYDSGWFGWNKILDRVIEDQTKVKDFAKGWNACIEELENG